MLSASAGDAASLATVAAAAPFIRIRCASGGCDALELVDTGDTARSPRPADADIGISTHTSVLCPHRRPRVWRLGARVARWPSDGYCCAAPTPRPNDNFSAQFLHGG